MRKDWPVKGRAILAAAGFSAGQSRLKAGCGQNCPPHGAKSMWHCAESVRHAGVSVVAVLNCVKKCFPICSWRSGCRNLNNRVTELTREISSLPKHIAEIEKKLESHTRKLDADRAALSANQTDRKKTEGEIQLQEQKISKLRGQMMDAKTNDQYRAFQNEIEFCEKEIRRAEDHILESMGESEPLDKNVKAAELALKDEKAQVEGREAAGPARAPPRTRKRSKRSTRSAPRLWRK